MQLRDDFSSRFQAITGSAPFPWQEALFKEFLNLNFPKYCHIPTGLGKTSIITIWLAALAHHHHYRTENSNEFPRRLVYVVNRRTVVDQATREAERIREALDKNPNLQEMSAILRSLSVISEPALAISSLRGQFADNAQWRDDPARPAVIVGTVDMIGSRLLFSGYGRGFKSRPLHAAFLAQNTLLVHDEAHLEPAFQHLISEIEIEHQECREFGRFRTMALTATSRLDGADFFQLSKADMEHHVVSKRVLSKKGISFIEIDSEKKLADEIARKALSYQESNQAILIFLRTLDAIETVRTKLQSEKQNVQTLTGTMRGLERDALAKNDPIFARFQPNPSISPLKGTVYLVCTAAGEVGIDLSADHLICDLSTFDSMAQRFGRVNRFGEGDAKIDIVCCDIKNIESDSASKKNNHRLNEAVKNTYRLLHKLPTREDERYNACPEELQKLPNNEKQAAFSPPPTILLTNEILFDAWTLTTIRQKLPGRPPVAKWLHGISEWEPPQTYVAWRQEVAYISGELLEKYKSSELEDLLNDYPIKPHELIRDRTDRIVKHLKKLSERHPESYIWIIDEYGNVAVRKLKDLDELDEKTVLLPPEIGGLSENGTLDGNTDFNENLHYDIADNWLDTDNEVCRKRIWDDDEPPEKMRLIRTIDTFFNIDSEFEFIVNDADNAKRYWHWYVRPYAADDDGSRAAWKPIPLKTHLRMAEKHAKFLVEKLKIPLLEADAIICAAKWHDLGKDRILWQRSIGNYDYPNQVLAKSGGKARLVETSNYRHELGTMTDVSANLEFLALSLETQDLVLHLIAAHHGRARPSFAVEECFDPKYNEAVVASVVNEVPRRFARLQKKYGRWGLAYLESLVRAVDSIASQSNDFCTDAQFQGAKCVNCAKT